MKKKIRRLLLAALTAVFLISGGLMVRDLVQSSRERKTNQLLAEQVHELRDAARSQSPAVKPAAGGESSSQEEVVLSPYAESGLLRQYDPLWQQNNDMAGWLWIEGTEIDYPVMYTPQKPEYYLRRDFYGQRASSGSLFIGKDSGPDDAMVMVFGHNMRDSSMFGELDRYLSEDYAKAHPIIHLDTLTEEREYEVVAAFRSRIYAVEEKGVFRYYQYTDLTDPENFERYLSQAKASSAYDTGVEAEFGDRILVLSTCSYHTENGRFAIVARQKTPEESGDT